MRVEKPCLLPLTLCRFWIFIQNEIGIIPTTYSFIDSRYTPSRKGRGFKWIFRGALKHDPCFEDQKRVQLH